MNVAKSKRIVWSLMNQNLDKRFTRQQIVDAFLADLIRKNKWLSSEETELLARFSDAVVDMTSILERHQHLADNLKHMIDAAARGEAERSNVKIEQAYSVLYSRNVSGVTRILISREKIRRLSMGKLRGVGYGADTLASKSYGLLVGETYQYAAKIILQNIIVLRRRVKYVKPLKPANKTGRRVDDWIITLSGGEKIPVEVKGSATPAYFGRAFSQIKNMPSHYRYALFVGFLPLNVPVGGSGTVVVILVSKDDTMRSFRGRINRILSAS